MAKKTAKPLTSLLSTEAAKIDVTDFSMNMPLHVLLGEAIDVARFTQHYWRAQTEPKSKIILRPGLELAGDSRLSESIADEILALHDLVQAAQTAHVLAIAPPEKTVERAEHVLDELAAALEWLCEDEVDSERRSTLTAITDLHRDAPDNEDALATELADYLGLAVKLEAELLEIGAFDPKLIDEAKRLVLALRDRSALRVRGRTTEASAFLQQRNQFAALLMQKVNRVRAAARYVFRNHDDIVKQVTSAYQRRRRAAARRRASDDVTTTPVTPEPVISAPAPEVTPGAPNLVVTELAPVA